MLELHVLLLGTSPNNDKELPNKNCWKSNHNNNIDFIIDNNICIVKQFRYQRGGYLEIFQKNNSIALFCHATTKMRHFLLLDLRGNLPG